MKIRQSTLHFVLTIAWASLVIPTILFWHNSILWVALMSVYAVVSTHWSAWEASRAKEAAEANACEEQKPSP